MQEIAKQFFSAIYNAIYPENKIDVDYSDVDWYKLYNLLRKNDVAPLVCEYITNLKKQYDIPDDILIDLRKETVVTYTSMLGQVNCIQKILEEAQKENVTCILFKGCILADLYPQYALRGSTDTDMLINMEDKDRIVSIMERLGYEKDEMNSKEFVYNYISKECNHVVEVHFKLWEDFTGNKIDLIEQMDLAKADSLIHLSACNLQVTTLGYEQHLIYQMFHIIKHFSIKGIGFRYLLDVTLYINRYIDQIDVNAFWGKMKILGYEQFCKVFFYLGVTYLKLDEKIMAGRTVTLGEEVDNLAIDLLYGGAVTGHKDDYFQILGIMTPYFVGNQEVSTSKKGRFFHMLFPSRDSLNNRFTYLQKHKYLLPVAWIHRIFSYCWYKLTHRKEGYGMKNKVTEAEYRLSMLQQLDLVKTKENK